MGIVVDVERRKPTVLRLHTHYPVGAELDRTIARIRIVVRRLGQNHQDHRRIIDVGKPVIMELKCPSPGFQAGPLD
jgi:hypothetical protein